MIVKFIKHFLPKGLLGRALLIIISPLILLQVISVWVFLDRHVERVTLQLSDSLTNEIAYVLQMMERYPEDQTSLIKQARSNYGYLEFEFIADEILPNAPAPDLGYVARILSERLERLNKPYRIDDRLFRKEMSLFIQRVDGVLKIRINGKRLFSVTTIIFILWMIGSSMLLFAIASMFMRNQIRPIRRLATAVDAFGKDQDAPITIKPEGANEVRQVALAFNRMQERIRRQMRQRTDMLSAVSHDLRTPITRMMLQIEFLEEVAAKQELQADLDEMQQMIGAYLAFARAQDEEAKEVVALKNFLDKTTRHYKAEGLQLDVHLESHLTLNARPVALRRLFDNLLTNAQRYAKTARVYIAERRNYDHAQANEPVIEILIDDDGPGIEEKDREAAFQPFVRLDRSRNLSSVGTGLGLAIVRDIVHIHGGKIMLEDSPLGGLRVRVRLPK